MQGHIYENPTDYSKNNMLQYNFAMQILDRSKIDPADRVLDLGCGDGRITFEIAKKAYAGCVIGTDISEKMTTYANNTYNFQENLRFLTMDTSKNVFKNQFEVITSFNSLHWVKNQVKALEGIAQAGTLDARIILLLSHKKSIYHYTLDTLCANSKWSLYFSNYLSPRSFFTKEQYKDFLIGAGLEISLLNEKEMTHEFNSIDALKTFLSASMAHIKQIPPPFKEEFLEDFCIEFLKQSNCNNNKISIIFWCLEVVAFKKALQKTDEIKGKFSPEIIQAKL